MNLNILTIDVLSAVPAQPPRPNSARNSQKVDGFDGFEQENGKISSENERFSKKWGEKSKIEGTTNLAGAQQSDNQAKTPVKDKTAQVRSFENTLKQQLKLTESINESAEAKTATKPQKAGQIQTLIRSQTGIAALVGQKQFNPDTKPATNIKQTAITNLEPSQENKQAASLVNQHKTAQKEVPQSSTIKDFPRPEFVEGNSSIRQIADLPKTSIDSKQPQKNTKTDSVKDADLKKPLESANINTDSIDLKIAKKPDNVSQVKQGIDLAENEAGTIQQQQISAGGQPRGTDTANNDRIESKPIKDEKKTSRTGDKQEITRFSDKLNVEKTEILSSKSDTAKPESAGDTTQAAAGKITAFDTGPIAANSSPNVSRPSDASANNPVQDNVASLREQIYQSVKTNVQQGTNQITIRLNPPELGQVSVKFSEKGNELTGLLEATNAQTRAEIRQALPEIIRSLEESGISIKRLDVTLSDLPRQSSQQQTARENAPQDLWEQFSHHGFRNDSGNHSTQDSYLTPAYGDNHAVSSNDVQPVTSFSSYSSPSRDTRLDILI